MNTFFNGFLCHLAHLVVFSRRISQGKPFHYTARNESLHKSMWCINDDLSDAVRLCGTGMRESSKVTARFILEKLSRG